MNKNRDFIFRPEKINSSTVNGIGYYAYTLPMWEGKRKKVYAKTKEELTEKCMNALEQMKREIEENQSPDFSKLTFGETLEHFFKYEPMNVNTRAQYTEVAKSFTSDFLSEDAEKGINSFFESAQSPLEKKLLTRILSYTGFVIKAKKKEDAYEILAPNTFRKLVTDIYTYCRKNLDDYIKQPYLSQSRPYDIVYDSIVLLVALGGFRLSDIPRLKATDLEKAGDMFKPFLDFQKEQAADMDMCKATPYANLNRRAMDNSFDRFSVMFKVSFTPVTLRNSLARFLLENGMSITDLADFLDVVSYNDFIPIFRDYLPTKSYGDIMSVFDKIR